MGEQDVVERPKGPDYTVSGSKLAAIHQQGDTALGILENHEPITFTPEEERRVVRKIDMVLMPLVRLAHRSLFFSS